MRIARQGIVVLFGLVVAFVGVTPASVASAAPVAPTSAPSSASTARGGPVVLKTVDAQRAATANGASASVRGPIEPAAPGSQGPLKYRGGRNGIGVTIGQPKVYLVFWGSQWGTANPVGSTHFSNDSLGVASRLVAMFNGLGTVNEKWSAVMTQYCDGVAIGSLYCGTNVPHVQYPSGSVLAGTWNDIAAPTPGTSTETQLANEAIGAAAHFGNTTPDSNRNAQYVIVSPKGTHPGGFGNAGFCAYHDDTDRIGDPTPEGDLAFTNMPYVPDLKDGCGQDIVNAGAAGLLDGVTIVEGHEYGETLTDQSPGGGWTDSSGFEISDKCAWLSTGTGHMQNISFATGSFAMQGNWSNIDNSCETSDPIAENPNAPDNYLLNALHVSDYVVPGDAASVGVQLATIEGHPETVSLSVTGLPPDSTGDFSATPVTTDDLSVLTVTTAATTPAGEYTLTIHATGPVSRSTTYIVNVGPPPTTLQNGQMVTGLSGLTGSDRLYEIDVPAQINVDVSMNGVNGDADIYIGKGAVPTDDAMFCRSDAYGDRDWCTWYNSVATTYFIRIHAAFAYSVVSLQATWTNPRRVSNKVVNTVPDAPAGAQQYFYFNVPQGATSIKIKLGMKSGNADLYVRIFGIPNPLVSDCASAHTGHRGESCSFKFRRPGLFQGVTFWIGVYTVTDATGMTIKPQYTVPRT
jgi:serine protease